MISESKALFFEAVKALAAQVTRNEYGDLAGLPAGSRFVAGRGQHNGLPDGLRATKVAGWSKYGPRRLIGHVVTDEVLALYGATVAAEAAQKKSAKNLAEQAAAQSAGHATVAAWKRAEKQSAAEEASTARARRDARTLARMSALGLEADLDAPAVGVLNVLEEAAASGREVDRDEIRAVVYAKVHESSAWLAYCEGEMSASDLLHRCGRAQHRHENTDYDELLRAGVDRESARDQAASH